MTVPRRVGVLLPTMAIALLLSSCGSDDDKAPGGQGADALRGRTFVSTAVTEDGEPRALVPGTRIELTFEQRGEDGALRWHAGCNTFGGEVEITADRLLTEAIGGTEMGCRRPLHEQDEWLAELFGSNPRWELSADRLTLSAESTAIELQAAGQA